MKLNNLSFPYPVLGISDDILPLPDKPKIDYIEKDPVNHIFDIALKSNNSTIDTLVKQGFAVYCCEIECQKTLFRKAYTSNNPDFTIEVPRKEVAGEILLTTTIVATSPIFNYNNPGVHPDYSEFQFSLDAGDLLCLFGQNIWNADIKYDKLKAVSTFMQIWPTDKDESYVDLDKNKIYLYLPKKLFDLYRGPISHNSTFAPALHASIALNAVVYAILNYEQYSDKLWAQTIHMRVLSEPEFKHYNLNCASDALPIAQILIGNPYKRMFDAMYKSLYTE
jgi:hypothetical protein